MLRFHTRPRESLCRAQGSEGIRHLAWDNIISSSLVLFLFSPGFCWCLLDLLIQAHLCFSSEPRHWADDAKKERRKKNKKRKSETSQQ